CRDTCPATFKAFHVLAHLRTSIHRIGRGVVYDLVGRSAESFKRGYCAFKVNRQRSGYWRRGRRRCEALGDQTQLPGVGGIGSIRVANMKMLFGRLEYLVAPYTGKIPNEPVSANIQKLFVAVFTH